MTVSRTHERFRVDKDDLVDNPAKRCPCMLVLDISGSMSGDPIAELNQGVGQFVQELQQHELASTSVELGVITFGSAVTELIDFTLMESIRVPLLTASGATAMGAAVSRAVQKLRQRRQTYRDNGVSSFIPWLVLMTDGGPTDHWEAAAAELRSLAEQRKLIVFAVGIGSSCNFETLTRFCPADRPPVRLTGLNFAPFFHFVSKSMEQVVSGKTADEGFALAAGAKDSDCAAGPAAADAGDDDPDDW